MVSCLVVSFYKRYLMVSTRGRVIFEKMLSISYTCAMVSLKIHAGWKFGTCSILCCHILGRIIPTHSYFFRGFNHQPVCFFHIHHPQIRSRCLVLKHQAFATFDLDNNRFVGAAESGDPSPEIFAGTLRKICHWKI